LTGLASYLFILPPQLDVFQPLTAAQHVVSQIQHMIALVIGQMYFE
jgi:hypothetical protein